MADNEAAPQTEVEVDPALEGLTEGAEGKELLEAVERALSAEGYDESKEETQRLKELLVKQPGWIGNIAMRLKTDAKTVINGIARAEQEIQTVEQLKADLEKELEELRENSSVKHVEELKEKLATYQKEKKEANAKVEEAEAAGRKPFANTDKGTRYVAFLQQRAELMQRSGVIKARCVHQAEVGFPKGDLAPVLQDVRNDEMQLTRLSLDKDRLTELAEGLRADGWKPPCDLEEPEKLLSEASAAAEDWRTQLTQEMARRTDLEKKMYTLFKEQKELLNWCTKQQQMLKHLSKHEDVIDFCTSLHELVPTMLENMTLVKDMSEPHLPNALVTAASVDLHNAWVKLQVTSYELLQKTLMEQHAASGLRDSVAAFAAWQKGSVKKLLDDAEELLMTPEKPGEKELVGTALELCKELQSEYQPHLILMGHLEDFEVRLELIEEHYQPMLKTVLSGLTALCQRIRLGSQSAFPGKAEYEMHINDLNDYIEARDTDTTAWERAKVKASQIQKLVVDMDPV